MNQTARNAQPWKRGAIIMIQAVLAVGVLAFIFQDRDRRRDMERAVRHASLAWMVAGVLCYGVVEVLGGLRWYLLLRVQGFRVSKFQSGVHRRFEWGGAAPAKTRNSKLRVHRR